MQDLLDEFDEREPIRIPSRYRLLGLFRILNILLMILFIISLVAQVMDAMQAQEQSLFITSLVMFCIFGSMTGIALFYGIKQASYELRLLPKSFDKSKVRWSSVVFNIIFSLGLFAVIIMQRETVSVPTFFVIVLSFFILNCISMLIFDLRYYRKGKV